MDFLTVPLEKGASGTSRLPRSRRHKGAGRVGRLRRAVGLLGARLGAGLARGSRALRAPLRPLVRALPFELAVLAIILAHTAALVAQSFISVRVRGEWFFAALDTVILCVYACEAVLKILALGSEYWRDFWNYVDFVVVAVMALDAVLFITLQSWASIYLKTSTVIRILLIFKGIRALQILNRLLTLRILENLKEVTGTFALSGRSLGAILLMMFTILSISLTPRVIFSVLLRDLFQRSDPQRFGDLFNTLFTLFQLFTLDDWSLIYQQSASVGYSYIIVFLMVYILIQYFTFLNLVIAVLIDNFQVSLLKEREEKEQLEQRRRRERSVERLAAAVAAAAAAGDGAVAPPAQQEPSEGAERELLGSYRRLLVAMEHHREQFCSRADTAERIVDAFFEAPEQELARP